MTDWLRFMYLQDCGDAWRDGLHDEEVDTGGEKGMTSMIPLMAATDAVDEAR